jgi:hypothetical protein
MNNGPEIPPAAKVLLLILLAFGLWLVSLAYKHAGEPSVPTAETLGRKRQVK